MFAQLLKKTLFSRIISFVVAFSFILISVPVSYANSDALRPLAAKENGTGALIASALAKTDGGQISYATIDAVNLEGKVVLVRPDINVPAANGHITDINRPHQRVVEAAKTIKDLAEKMAKVVVIYHQGRPGELDFMDTPFEHAQQMSALIGRRIKTVNDLFGPEAIAAIKALKPGEILFLKPVRAADPTIQGKILEENPYFTSVLRQLIDYFVLDGFSVAHRDSNSVTGFKGVPTLAGRLMAREIDGASNMLNPAKPRVVAIGGGKLADKFPGFVGELDKADKVFIGGRLANLALVAAQPEAKGAKTEEEQYNLALKTVGKPTADELKAEGLNLLPQLVTLLAKHKDKIIVPVDMVYLDETGARHDVDLINGRVSEGFNFLLKGIGPKTAQRYVEIIQKTEPPFKSFHLMGPLSDSRYDVLLEETKQLLQAIKGVDGLFFSTGGGDTNIVLDKLGVKPSYTSLAGSALGEFLAGKVLPGAELLKNNQPNKLKPYVPATYAETHTLAHTEVLGPIAKALQEAGGKLFVRTHVFSSEGGRVDAARFIKTPMSTAIMEALRKSLGNEITQVLAGLETVDVDTINPNISFSVSNIYTPDNRPINPSRLRQALAKDANVALILVPGEIDKKGKPGPAGDIDSKKVTTKLEKVLYQALSEHGVDARVIKQVVPKPLPAIAQLTQSDIASELKLAVLVPTPGSEIYRLMQLAQDAGINLKELFEKKLPVVSATDIQAEEQMAQEPLLGEPLTLVEQFKKMAKPQEPSPLAGLSLVASKINTTLQTIFIGGPNLTPNEQNVFSVRRELREIQQRVLATQKVVRIVVPAGSETERTISNALQVEIPGLTLASHPMLYNGRKAVAFIIRPTKRVILVGYGNEAIKLAPLYRAAAYGVPDEETGVPVIAVAIHSLMRPERVVHAFEIGLNLYWTDMVKDKAGNVINKFQDPNALTKVETELKDLLVRAFTAKARNMLLHQLPESERLQKANDPEIFRKAKELGRKEAEERFAKQYKGVLSKAILAGEYDLIDDASPGGSGATNKELLYEPAIKANPNKKIVAIYQGGEKEKIGQASFSTVSAVFEDVVDLTHVRHVSCNTTALSTIVLPLLEELGIHIDLDNTAFRRGPDPGDLKAGSAGITIQTKYHHYPDFVSVTPEDLQALLRGNTDAAQIGTNTRFHIHMLYLRRADGKAFDEELVKRIEAVQSRVALVDFPADSFDSTRLTEVAHNLLHQQIFWSPDGANHLLVPVLMVQRTDDPAQLRLIYAVPQESIVAPGNVNAADALFGQATRDASMAIINDASGITQIVSAVETRLPVKAVEPEKFASALETSEFSAAVINTMQAIGVDVEKLRGFIKADEAIYQALAGSSFGEYISAVKTSLSDEKPRVLAVSTGFFKAGGVTTALNRIALLNKVVRIAIYGENAEKYKILLSNNADVVTAGTASELVTQLTQLGIAPADILAVGSSQDEAFARMQVRQIVAKEAGSLAVAKAMKELLGTDAADAAFSEFYAGVEKSGAISPEVSSATKEAMLAKLQEGTFEFPDDIKPTQQTSERIAADDLAVSEFIDQI